MNTKRFSPYAPVVLRFTLSAVFVWFGVSQLSNAAAWTSLVPDWATGLSGLNAETIVHLNGVFEVIVGSMLAFGAYVQLVAAILFLHLLVITSHLGFTAIGVRDFGLSFATLSLALFGDDNYCVTCKEETQNSKNSAA